MVEPALSIGGPEDLGRDEVGVFVCSPSRSNTHAGVVFRRGAGRARFVHLAFHHELRDESAVRGTRVAVPTIPPVVRNQLIVAIERVIKGRPISYAVRYQRQHFDLKSGRLVLGEDERGLTCATFVLALFASVGQPLVDVDTWPARESDAAWHAKIVELLAQYGAGHAHVEAVREENGCARFRPAEVTAAAALYPPTQRFDELEKHGADLRAAVLAG